MSTTSTWASGSTGAKGITITGPNATTVYTEEIPAASLSIGYITLFASASATLTNSNTFDLYGSYDGTTFVKFIDDIIASTNLSTPAAGSVNLEAWPSLSYKIAVYSAANESSKEITFRITSRNTKFSW